ncbi:MAG: ABC transporter permease [Anaerolineales bacterium]|nr:ABC transporter permease [Anaerolineales bacterium]
MNLTENFRIALRALAANKLRSILTMLGIIIGVGAVVGLMAIGQGATSSITSQVEGIGANLISISAGRFDGAGGPQQSALYLSDYEALRRDLDPAQVAGIAPTIQANATVTYAKETVTLQVVGTTPDFLAVRSYELERGRFINAGDRSSRARVTVLGSQTATDLFGGMDPLGRKVKIGGVSYEVIGVLKTKGSSGFGSADETVLIPLETGYDKLTGPNLSVGGRRTLGSISISAASAEVVDGLMSEIDLSLRRAHGLRPTEAVDFNVLSQTQFLSTLTTITTTLTVFLGAIAGISLLVGGIGIMNIMLVSVTERTKEIGLRKAVGAKSSAIMLQFLVETLVLSLVGGLLGIGLGLGIAAGVTFANLITAQVTWDSIALAFGFSAAVGIFFGLYPAWRAARLRPIEALRYE